MVQTVILEGFENRQLITTQSKVEPYNMYIMSRDISESWSYLTGYYEGIVRYNYQLNQVDQLLIPNGFQLSSNSFYNEYFYCSRLMWEGKTANLILNQIDCKNLILKDSITLKIEDNSSNPENSSLSETELYGLGERYLVVCVPQIESQKFTRHSNCILVDFLENKYYSIPEKIGQDDTFLNVNNIKVIDKKNKKFVYFTTGSLSYSNKKNAWNHREKENSNFTESIVIIDYNLFIEQIKNDLPISETCIVGQCDNSESFVLENNKNECVYWYKHNLRDETYILKIFNPFSENYLERIIDGKYDVIYFFNDDLYGVKESEHTQVLYDASNNKELYTVENSSYFYYGNKEWIVFFENPTNSFNMKWIVYDLIHNKEVASMESPHPTVDYIKENNTIIFIK
jgi:hypothetical protein